MKYGSFFRPAGRYRTEAQLQTAHDHLRYAGELMRMQLEADAIAEQETRPAPAVVTCETHADHRFDPGQMSGPSVQCTRCGAFFENPALFYAAINS